MDVLAVADELVRRDEATAAAIAEVADAQRRTDELRERAARLAAETAQVEREAREVALALGRLPRLSAGGAEAPTSGLDGVLEWSSRARAALFVTRGSLEREREQIVREANELGSSVLGEPLAATSVSLVRERLARASAR